MVGRYRLPTKLNEHRLPLGVRIVYNIPDKVSSENKDSIAPRGIKEV